MSFCTKCEEPLPTDGSFVECTGCQGELHFKCTTISAKTHAGMSADRRTRWRCDFCRLASKVAEKLSKKLNVHSNSPPISGLLEPLQNSIEQLDKKMDECLKSQAFISDQYDLIKQKQDELSVKISNLEKKVADACNFDNENSSVIDSLMRKMNRLEQESRRNELLLNGVQELPNENLHSLVSSVARRVNTEIKEGDIENIYRLKSRRIGGTTANTARPMVISFRDRMLRNRFLNSRKGALIKNGDVIAGGSDTNILIFEFLSPYYIKLLRLARQKAVASGWKYVWFSDNSIKCRKEDLSPIIYIDFEKDLEKIC